MDYFCFRNFAFSFALLASVHLQGQTITTFAGNGTAGYVADGVEATATEINSPWGVAVDAAGNVYIGDSPNNRIRKVNTAGIISTIAGNGTAGFAGDGGQATDAMISNPSGVAVDAAGNIYIADNGNARIRKVSALGIITTIAGNGTPGYTGDGGAATSASITPPDGVAVDPTGNVYISSHWSVRRINTAGIISRFAGNGAFGYSGDGGPATNASVGESSDIETDRYGNVYFTDFLNHCARKVNASGIISTIAGNGTPGFWGDGGAATASMLDFPVGIDVDDAGNVYIGDRDNERLRMIDAHGVINTITGTGVNAYSGDGGAATAAKINKPHALAHDACGNLYFCDRVNNRVRMIADLPLHIAGIVTGRDTVCPGDTVQMNDFVTGGMWSLTNNTIAHIGSGGLVTGVIAGIDTVRYVVANPCFLDTAYRQIVVLAAATCALKNDLHGKGEHRLVIYPNPGNGTFTMRTGWNIAGMVELNVKSITGVVVQQLSLKAGEEQEVHLKLPPGVYFILASDGSHLAAERLVIQ